MDFLWLENKQQTASRRAHAVQEAKSHHKVDKRAEYCWFARDVTTAMLVVKNESISVLWELNYIFM